MKKHSMFYKLVNESNIITNHSISSMKKMFKEKNQEDWNKYVDYKADDINQKFRHKLLMMSKYCINEFSDENKIIRLESKVSEQERIIDRLMSELHTSMRECKELENKQSSQCLRHSDR